MKTFTALVLFFTALPVLAAGTAYDISVGFELEPVVVEERNALLLVVQTPAGDPVPGLEETIELELVLGKFTQRFPVEPGINPGTYRLDIVPTASGPWEVRVIGEIGEETVYEVFSCVADDFSCGADRSVLGFPAPAIESASLTKRLAELEVGVANATASDPMSFFGVIAGVLGLLAGGAALVRRKD